MAKKMLIDATQADETRIVVLNNGEVEEIEFERADRQQLKSNIYLARITRVEPSLQAAFVDYGGNRHGFLPFSEIHPDYYQIPVEDRQALLDEADELFRKAQEEREARDAANEERAAKRAKSKEDAPASADEIAAGETAEGDKQPITEPENETVGAGAADEEAATPKKRVRRKRASTAKPATEPAPIVEADSDSDHAAVAEPVVVIIEEDDSNGLVTDFRAAAAESSDAPAHEAAAHEAEVEPAPKTEPAPEQAVALEETEEDTTSAKAEAEDRSDDDAPKTMAAAIEADEDLVAEISETVPVPDEAPAAPVTDGEAPITDSEAAAETAPAAETEAAAEAEAPAKPKRRSRAKKAPAKKAAADKVATEQAAAELAPAEPAPASDETKPAEDQSVEVAESEAVAAEEAPAKPKRRTRKPKAKPAAEKATKKSAKKDAASSDDESDTPVHADQLAAETSDDDDDNGVDSDGEYNTGDDAADAENQRRAIMRTLLARRYKIQEVIKRRQIMLVQVAKEERGNKGAALTTYLSLAGRYCVLMPNTARGGGISRKIASAKDRKRLKTIVDDINVPPGLSVIVRTAGSERTKAEIRRDYDYLIRTWDSIRNTTLESQAPTLIYEEGNIIKRAIRDIYSSDTEAVVVDGERGYETARALMKALTPSHMRRVQLHPANETPLFVKAGVEDALEKLHDNVVQLPSGGYIVMNQTEALVAIDVNSGKAIKERHIEDTALKTNLEAATVVAEQLRLRDLAGLVVVDFIDMEENKHNAQVERRIREGLKKDRARIQVGRISSFGLLELSRQRLRPSVIESSRDVCPTCAGDGHVRAAAAVALAILRQLEQRLPGQDAENRNSLEALKGAKTITLKVNVEIAMGMLNRHRDTLSRFEQQHGVRVNVQASSDVERSAFAILVEDDAHGQVEVFTSAELENATSRDDGRGRRGRRSNRGRSESASGERSESRNDSRSEGRNTRSPRRVEEPTETAQEADSSSDDETETNAERSTSRRSRGGRGRGRRRGGRSTEAVEEGSDVAAPTEGSADQDDTSEAAAKSTSAADEREDELDENGEPKKRRRRGKRGGRRRTKAEVEADNALEAAEAAEMGKPTEAETDADAAPVEPDAQSAAPEVIAPEVIAIEDASEEAPATEKLAATEEPLAEAAEPEEPVAEAAGPEEPVAEAAPEPLPEAASSTEPEAQAEAEVEAEPQPKRRGWWSR